PGQPGSRSLTGTEQRISIATVQSAMAKMFQDIVGVVDRVGTAWTALPRLDTLDAALTGLIQTAGASGIKPPAELAHARTLDTSLRGQVHADPLAAEVA